MSFTPLDNLSGSDWYMVTGFFRPGGENTENTTVVNKHQGMRGIERRSCAQKSFRPVSPVNRYHS